jgi:hypothetical protein
MDHDEARANPWLMLHLCRTCDGGWIGVEGEHEAIRGRGREERPRVTAAAEGAVDVTAARVRLQRVDRRVEQHRPMTGR